MLRIELMPWESAREFASPIRFAVFVEEQGVPPEIELDEMDAQCVHAVCFDDATPVGTGRLLPDGHIGRMAVLAPWRRNGVGGRLLQALMGRAKERGDAEVVLSAQVRAVEFYRRHGFETRGPVYEEAGISHQEMCRRL
jgi:hypothetical protein